MITPRCCSITSRLTFGHERWGRWRALVRDLAERWLPAIEGRLKDTDHDVRLAAVRALATIRRERAAEVMRPFLANEDPRLVATAAIALADSTVDSDVEATERALQTLVNDTRESGAEARREVARIIPLIQNARFRHLLIPLFYDPDTAVALEAIRSAAEIGAADALSLSRPSSRCRATGC